MYNTLYNTWSDWLWAPCFIIYFETDFFYQDRPLMKKMFLLLRHEKKVIYSTLVNNPINYLPNYLILWNNFLKPKSLYMLLKINAKITLKFELSQRLIWLYIYYWDKYLPTYLILCNYLHLSLNRTSQYIHKALKKNTAKLTLDQVVDPI